MSTDPSVRIPEWTIGDRLRKARVSAGFEQTEFAAVTGITRGTIHNYESDKTSRHKRPYLVAWSLATGVPVEWLEHGTGSSAGPTPPGNAPHGDKLARLTESKRGRTRHAGSGTTDRYSAAA